MSTTEARASVEAVRAYLEEKAGDPREWLRRDPRETHPVILALVREALQVIEPSQGGTIYDDDVERHVNLRVGNLPPHSRHGTDGRDPLVVQLGHEVYIARVTLRDEEATAAIMAALEEGYVPVQDAALEPGRRYLVRPGVLYSGYAVAWYGKPREVRPVADGDRIVFLPKGARTRGFLPVPPMLVRELQP